MSRTEAPFRRVLDVRLAETEGPHASLRPALIEAGCAVTPMGLASPRGRAADAFVADLRGSDRPLGLVNRARQAAGATPLVLVTGPAPLAGLSEAAGTHVLVQVAADPAPVVRALGRAVRAADLAREAGLRLAAMTALEQPLSPGDVPREEARVAVLAEPGAHALETLHALEGAFDTAGVLTRAQALRALEAGDVGALVIAPGPERRDMAALVRLIRRQSVLHDVPVVVSERRRTERHVAYWARIGADGCFVPAEESLLAASVRAGVRRRAMTRRLRALLARTVLNDGGAETRLAGSALFDACLAERCRRGAGPFALGAIRLSAREGAPAPAALTEAAMYLSFGVGAEDLMARPAPDLFLFQLTSSDARGAERTLRALAGLAADLKFGEEGAAQTFESRVAVTSWRPEDDAQAMIVRTLKGVAAARARIAAPV